MTQIEWATRVVRTKWKKKKEIKLNNRTSSADSLLNRNQIKYIVHRINDLYVWEINTNVMYIYRFNLVEIANLVKIWLRKFL